MGANNCGCLSVLNKALKEAVDSCVAKQHYEVCSVFEEEEATPAGLLSEHEIQKLLNESNDLYKTKQDYND